MEVLSYLPQKDLLSCALVQKKWTEPSLNAAWHTVEDLSSLLRLLAPLVRVGQAHVSVSDDFCLFIDLNLLAICPNARNFRLDSI